MVESSDNDQSTAPTASAFAVSAASTRSQVLQIQTALRPLILPSKRREYLAREVVQLAAHPLALIRSHAARSTAPTTINKT